MLNVSRQMDAPFLLSTTGGDAAKILGNLSGITKIDTGLASLRPDISAQKKVMDVAEKMIKNYDASVGEFAGLDESIAALEEIGKRLASAGVLNTRLGQLRDVLERMASYNEIVHSVDAEIAKQQRVLAIEPQIDQAGALHVRTQELVGLTQIMDRFNAQTTTVEAELKEAALEVTSLEQAYKALLHEAGQCPMCGAKT
jgi:chromosome segregation ATPase